MREIGIKNLHLNCVIGCPGWERHEPQRLIVDVTLELDSTANWLDEDLSKTCCYGQVQRITRFILENGRFYLLENAAEFLTRYFLLPPPSGSQKPHVRKAGICLVKPDILPGETDVVVSLLQERQAVTFTSQIQPWGILEGVAQNQHASLERLVVDPGQGIPAACLKSGFSVFDHVFEEKIADGKQLITRLMVSNS